MAAGGAVDLDGIGSGVNGSAGGEILGHEGAGVGLGRMFIFRAAGAPAEEPGGFHIRAHFGEERLNHAQLTDAVAASPARGGITGALFKASAQKPERGTGGAETTELQADLGDVREAEAGFANDVGGGDVDIVKPEPGEAGGAKAHQIFDGFDLKTLGIPRDETGDGLIIQFAKHQKYPSHLAATDPFFFAVQNQIVRAFHAAIGGGHGMQIAAGTGLGQGEGADDIALRERRQPLTALFGAAPFQQGGGDHGLNGDDTGECRIAAAQGFIEQAEGDGVPTLAAVFGGEIGTEITGAGELSEGGGRNRLRLVPSASEWLDVRGSEFLEGRVTFALGGGEELVHVFLWPEDFRATKAAVALTDLKFSMSRSSMPISMANLRSTKVMSCTAKRELMRPDSKRLSSSPNASMLIELLMNARMISLTWPGSCMLISLAYVGVRFRFREVFAFRIMVKSLPGFPSALAGGDQLAQQGAAFEFGIVKGFVEDIERIRDGVQADEIGGLERAHLVAETLLEQRIDLGGGGEAFLEDEGGFVHEEMGDAVGDEAGAIADDDGLFFQLREQLAGGGERGGGSVRAADDFDRGHARHGVHEVHADDAVRAVGDGGDAGDGNAGGVDTKTDFEREEPAELFVDWLLDFPIFGDVLDDEFAAGGVG